MKPEEIIIKSRSQAAKFLSLWYDTVRHMEKKHGLTYPISGADLLAIRTRMKPYTLSGRSKCKYVQRAARHASISYHSKRNALAAQKKERAVHYRGFGKRLCDARSFASMSPSTLAWNLRDTLHSSTTTKSILAWERGLRRPHAHTLEGLASILNVRYDWLVYGLQPMRGPAIAGSAPQASPVLQSVSSPAPGSVADHVHVASGTSG